jgi:choline-sulfatase
MSMLTGLLPTRTQVHGNRASLASSIPTIAHAMAAAGYRTVLCGRMHFIGPDQRHGFHERFVGDHSPTDTAFTETARGIYDGTTGQDIRAVEMSGVGVSPHMQYDDAVTDTAVRRLQAQDADSPLFLVVGYYGPHNPYVCERERYEKYRSILPDLPVDAVREFLSQESEQMKQWVTSRGLEQLDAEAINRARAAYYGSVERIDELAGKVYTAADSRLGSDRLLKIYASDHGDMAGENGLFFKSNMREPAVRVPLVCGGAGVARGRAVTTPVSLLDLAPTLIDYASAPPLPASEGRSLLPSIATGEEPSAEPVVSMLCDPRMGPSVMVRSAAHKYVKHQRYREPEVFQIAGGVERPVRDDSPDYWSVRTGLEAMIPEAWDGEALERHMALQSERDALHRAWMRTCDAQVTEIEDRHRFQVDLQGLHLSVPGNNGD